MSRIGAAVRAMTSCSAAPRAPARQKWDVAPKIPQRSAPSELHRDRGFPPQEHSAAAAAYRSADSDLYRIQRRPIGRHFLGRQRNSGWSITATSCSTARRQGANTTSPIARRRLTVADHRGALMNGGSSALCHVINHLQQLTTHSLARKAASCLLGDGDVIPGGGILQQLAQGAGPGLRGVGH